MITPDPENQTPDDATSRPLHGTEGTIRPKGKQGTVKARLHFEALKHGLDGQAKRDAQQAGIPPETLHL